MTEDMQQRLEKAEWALNNSGFRRCDIAACNCGSWHQVGGFRARFDEVKEAVEEAGYSTNGKTLLDAVRQVISDAAGRSWQPLETAPTDGMWVLLFEGFGVNTKWSRCEVGRYHDGNWWDSKNMTIPHPTHWMPLPHSP